MDTFSLICFVKLAETSKFYEAAETVHISQSSFSKHIQSLERELGAKLVVRNRDGSELTEAGRMLLPYALEIAGEYENSLMLVDNYKKAIPRRLDVYTHSFLSNYGITGNLFRFQRENPDIDMEIHEMESTYAIQNLYLDPAVACITFSEVGSIHDNLEQWPLCYDELVFVTGRGGKYAGRERIHISELRDVELQVMKERQESFLYAFILQQCRKAGFLPKLGPHELWFSTLAELLHVRDYNAVIPRRIGESALAPSLKMLPIEGIEQLSVQLTCERENKSEIMERFFSFMKANPLP